MAYILELWPRSELEAIQAHYNPRVISDRKLRSLSIGMQKVGCRIPCIVNTRTNRLVSGHQRLKAAALIDMEQLPVKKVDLSEEEEKALNLALNNIEGEWDYDLLPDFLAIAVEADLQEMTGFSNTELLTLLAGAETETEDVFNGFAQKGKQYKNLPYIEFHCSRFKFKIDREEYDSLLERIKTKVGPVESDMTTEFYRMIGLNVKEAITE